MKLKPRKRKNVVIFDIHSEMEKQGDRNYLQEAIEESIAEGAKNILLNFQMVEVIGSSFLGRLVLLSRYVDKNNGKLIISNLSDYMEEVFSFMTLKSKIPVYADEEEALRNI